MVAGDLMKHTSILTIGIVFLLLGCIAQEGEEIKEALIEPDIPEGDILAVINKWNHEIVESSDPRFLPSWMLASLMDPVVSDIVENLHTDPENLEKSVEILRLWTQENEAHTQGLPVFAYTPGNDPWGTVPNPWGYKIPTYKKLLPSEMKAMSIFSGKITGKCMTLANLNACLFRFMGADPDNVVVVRTKTHGVGLVKFGGRVYLINNNSIIEINGSIREEIVSRTFSGLWTESFSVSKEFILNEDVLDSQDTLLDAIWRVNWGTDPPPRTVLLPGKIQRTDVLSAVFGEFNAANRLAVLTKYAYQSLHVGKPELYLKASVRSPRAIELAERLGSADEIIEWIKKNVGTGSIFEEYQERVMLADQVIVFKTGGLKDQAVLAFTLLKLKGYDPVVTVTTDTVYVEFDGRMYDVKDWNVVDSVTGTVELVLHLKPKEKSFLLGTVMCAFQEIPGKFVWIYVTYNYVTYNYS